MFDREFVRFMFYMLSLVVCCSGAVLMVIGFWLTGLYIPAIILMISVIGTLSQFYNHVKIIVESI